MFKESFSELCAYVYSLCHLFILELFNYFCINSDDSLQKELVVAGILLEALRKLTRQCNTSYFVTSLHKKCTRLSRHLLLHYVLRAVST
jgi:hypothetical protein